MWDNQYGGTSQNGGSSYGNNSNNASYDYEYNKTCSLEAAVHVLEDKHKDYQRILKGIESEFEETVKKLAVLQVDRDDLLRFSWPKVKAKLTRSYNKKYEELSSKIDETQKEIDYINYRIRENKGKIKDLEEELKKVQKEFKEQRDHMTNAYGHGNVYEQKINEENLKLHGLVKEIDEAVVAIDQVLEIAKKAKEYYESAKKWGIADAVFDGGILSDVIKYNKINDAQGMVYALNSAVASMNKELRDVNQVYGVYCQQFSGTMQFMDIWFDNLFVDVTVMNKITNNINQLNAFVEKVRSVRDNLLSNKKQILNQIKK